MTTSDEKKDKLIQDYSQKAKDTKPVGQYTKKELIDLEHKWRINLKSSGFSDIEMWDNKPNKKSKRIKFIKGHIRHSHYEKYKAHVVEIAHHYNHGNTETNGQLRKFWKGFKMNADESFEFFRIIGLFAHHAPRSVLPDKYRKLLQHYAQHGLYTEAIDAVAPKIKPSAIQMYVRRNFNRMIQFINTLNRENLDSYEQRTDYN